MQLSNVMLRLGGSLLHTVQKTNVTPAEILVLQHIHGTDAVVDIRPTKFDKNRGHGPEFERLANLYDAAASASAPGEEAGAILTKLFPGAIKKLPRTLKEIGLGAYEKPEPAAKVEPEPEAVEDSFDEGEDGEDPFQPTDESEAA